jgi:hypothetical protein
MLQKLIIILILSSSTVFAAGGSLTVKVAGPAGESLKGVTAGVQFADGTGEPVSVRTAGDGTAAFPILAPGKYIVYLNPAGKISARMPFPRLFYPGKARRAEAAEVEVSEGGKKELEFKIAQLYPTVTVRGRFIFEDGVPYPGDGSKFVFTGLRLDRFDHESEVEVDDEGNFELKLLKGSKGMVETAFDINETRLRDCDGLREHLRTLPPKPKPAFPTPKPESFLRLRSAEFTATEDLSGIEVKLPFKACRRKMIV